MKKRTSFTLASILSLVTVVLFRCGSHQSISYVLCGEKTDLYLSNKFSSISNKSYDCSRMEYAVTKPWKCDRNIYLPTYHVYRDEKGNELSKNDKGLIRIDGNKIYKVDFNRINNLQKNMFLDTILLPKYRILNALTKLDPYNPETLWLDFDKEVGDSLIQRYPGQLFIIKNKKVKGKEILLTLRRFDFHIELYKAVDRFIEYTYSNRHGLVGETVLSPTKIDSITSICICKKPEIDFWAFRNK